MKDRDRSESEVLNSTLISDGGLRVEEDIAQVLRWQAAQRVQHNIARQLGRKEGRASAFRQQQPRRGRGRRGGRPRTEGRSFEILRLLGDEEEKVGVWARTQSVCWKAREGGIGTDGRQVGLCICIFLRHS